MKPQTKKLISISVLIVLALLLAYYIKTTLSDFKKLTLVNPLFIIILIILFIFSYFTIGLITKNLLKPLNVKLKGIEAFALSIVTGFYNLITPFRGGMATRAVYLKKKHDFSYTNFLATLAASYILVFLIASFLGLLSTYLIYLSEGIFSWILFLIFLGLFLSLSFIVIFSPKFQETRYNFINNFIKVINGWHLIKDDKRIIFIVSFLTLIQLLIGTLMLYLQFKVFGIEIDLIKCLFLVSIGNISMLFAITPANLGVGEAITVFSASTIGITAIHSLSATILGRAISFLVLFILGPIFSYILLKHNPKKQENEIK